MTFLSRAHSRAAISLTAVLILAIQFAGCAQGDIEQEFRALISDSHSAQGSDLACQLFGWPVRGKIRLESLNVTIAPGHAGGSGTAIIIASVGNYRTSGSIFFTYDSVYMGGHGSGGTATRLGLLRRDDRIDPAVSSPAGARAISFNETVSIDLEKDGMSLPDGSRAAYFFMNLGETEFDPAIRVILESIGDNHATTNCTVFKEGFPVSSTIGSMMDGIRLKPGKVFILVTSSDDRGRFSLRVIRPDAETRAKLIRPAH